MPRAAILYATREGQTRKIAEHLATALRSHGLDVEVGDVRATPVVNLAPYDTVVLAASIHAGHHEKEMVQFVRAHREQLERVPTTFISVCMREAVVEDLSKPAAQREEAAQAVKSFIDAFVAETGWQPTHIQPAAGAFPYSKYSPFIRFLVRHIAKAVGEPDDVTRDYEMTDWKVLDDLAGRLATQLGAAT